MRQQVPYLPDNPVLKTLCTIETDFAVETHRFLEFMLTEAKRKRSSALEGCGSVEQLEQNLMQNLFSRDVPCYG